jgi:hypothetical protein
MDHGVGRQGGQPEPATVTQLYNPVIHRQLRVDRMQGHWSSRKIDSLDNRSLMQIAFAIDMPMTSDCIRPGFRVKMDELGRDHQRGADASPVTTAVGRPVVLHRCEFP